MSMVWMVSEREGRVIARGGCMRHCCVEDKESMPGMLLSRTRGTGNIDILIRMRGDEMYAVVTYIDVLDLQYLAYRRISSGSGGTTYVPILITQSTSLLSVIPSRKG
jgi:hypothetical protein